MDSRPAYEYVPTERAAAAFRTQFGAAPDAEVDGEYCFEGLVYELELLEIWRRLYCYLCKGTPTVWRGRSV